MGARKRLRAEEIKSNKAKQAKVMLNKCQSSPRKMRLVTNLIAGKDVYMALHILRNCAKEASKKLETLVLAAMDSWKSKNKEIDLEQVSLFIQEIKVDGGSFLKRMKPAPQGRAHRIRKRSNHVTVVLNHKELSK